MENSIFNLFLRLTTAPLGIANEVEVEAEIENGFEKMYSIHIYHVKKAQQQMQLTVNTIVYVFVLFGLILLIFL